MYTTVIEYFSNKYIKNHRDSYANLLSAKNGSEALVDAPRGRACSRIRLYIPGYLVPCDQCTAAVAVLESAVYIQPYSTAVVLIVLNLVLFLLICDCLLSIYCYFANGKKPGIQWTKSAHSGRHT